MSIHVRSSIYPLCIHRFVFTLCLFMSISHQSLALFRGIYIVPRSIRVAERLALPTSNHGVAGSNPAGGDILPEPKWRFVAQSLSYSPFHRLEMTEILLKGCKTLTDPSIILYQGCLYFNKRQLFM